MVKNTDFLGSMNTNPYYFRHYDLSYFLNGKQIPTEGLVLNNGHEKTSVMGYRTLFEASGIHHSNSKLQITHHMHINSNFMLFFDLTPDRSASERYIHVLIVAISGYNCKSAIRCPIPSVYILSRI